MKAEYQLLSLVESLNEVKQKLSDFLSSTGFYIPSEQLEILSKIELVNVGNLDPCVLSEMSGKAVSVGEGEFVNEFCVELGSIKVSGKVEKERNKNETI